MKRGFVLLGLIFFISFVSASYSFGNFSIESYYDSSSNIKGWVEMSFVDESTQSFFTDSFGNEISLLNVLKSYGNANYTCSTDDCGSDYSASNGRTVASFSMGIASEKLMGLKIDQDISSIKSMTFVVNSTTEKSCYNQLTFDFGLDDVIESGNTKSSSEKCPFLKDYGCYDESKTENYYIIPQMPNKQCQGINLTESAGFNIGAWIKPSASPDIAMALYNINGEALASCDIEGITIEGEYDCEVDYVVSKPEKYYVCVYSKNSESPQIKGYGDSENGCGFYGEGVQTEDASFKIYAEGRKFDRIDVMNITNALPQGNSLAAEINDYILGKYGTLACSKGCVIPFKIKSQTQQNVQLRNLELQYETNKGNVVENRFYDIEGSPSIINMNSQKIYLDDAGFKTSSGYGNVTFTLKFNDYNVLSKEIYIEELPTPGYVTPTKTAAAFPTSFKVLVDSTNISIKKYIWEFGDGAKETTTTNSVTHTYENISTYEMKVIIEDASGRNASGKFNIVVTSPKELIEETIVTMGADIETLSSDIKGRELFEQTAIKSVINIDEISEEFKQIQRDYQTAQTEEEYKIIIKKLLDINLPHNLITSSKTENFLFFPQENVVNLAILQKIAGGNYEGYEDEYINSVRAWEQGNIEVKVDFKEISGIYDGRQEGLIRTFKVKLKAKENMGSDDVYLILKNMENLSFKENYLEQEDSGYYFIDIKDSESTIEFATREDINFVNLPMFISPSIERLELMKPPTARIINMKWSSVVWMITIILIVSLGIYIFLQEWYKRKYESYLFERRNDLYNLIVYAKDAKEKGMDNGQIKSKLKSQGWSGEQSDYVIKKYLGKRTGMIEIPISKIIDKINELFQKIKNRKSEAINEKPVGTRGPAQKTPQTNRFTPSRKI